MDNPEQIGLLARPDPNPGLSSLVVQTYKRKATTGIQG